MAYNQSSRGPLFYSTQQSSTSRPPPSLGQPSTYASDSNAVSMADFPALSNTLRDPSSANASGLSFSSIAAAGSAPYYGNSRREIDLNGVDDFPALTPSSVGTRSINSTPSAPEIGYGMSVRRDAPPPGINNMVVRGPQPSDVSSNYYSSSRVPPPPLVSNNSWL